MSQFSIKKIPKKPSTRFSTLNLIYKIKRSRTRKEIKHTRGWYKILCHLVMSNIYFDFLLLFTVNSVLSRENLDK